MLACVRQYGPKPVATQIVEAFCQADTVLGGGTSMDAIRVITTLFIDDFKGRPIGTILLAIRYGIQQKAIGHKLTYPMLCEWVAAIDAQVEEHNYNEYLRTK